MLLDPGREYEGTTALERLVAWLLPSALMLCWPLPLRWESTTAILLRELETRCGRKLIDWSFVGVD